MIEKLKSIDWVLYGAVSLLACIGTLALYSAGDGSFTPWAKNHIIRYCCISILMFVVALVPLRFWYRMVWIFYLGGLGLLIYVEFAGHVGMGAQRWISLGGVNLQPSEIMKIALILVLAQFYNTVSKRHVSHPIFVCIALGLILIPAVLVFLQPDLGTAILLTVGGVSIIIIAGLAWYWIVGGIVAVLTAIPMAWVYVLLPYQKRRIMTFIDPSTDTLGQGYHILQSKIAIGSGGFLGRGFIQGEQSQFGFLPEKHTDFIFAVISEEFGFLGAIAVLLLAGFIILRIFLIAFSVWSIYAKMVCIGMGTTFFLYVLINTGMVMGIFPVVGVPFPLLSNGGTVMLTIMIAVGFVQNAWVHRLDTPIVLSRTIQKINTEYR